MKLLFVAVGLCAVVALTSAKEQHVRVEGDFSCSIHEIYPKTHKISKELEKTAEDLKKATEEVKKLTTEKEKADKALEAVQKQKEEADGKVADLNGEIGSLKTKISELRGQKNCSGPSLKSNSRKHDEPRKKREIAPARFRSSVDGSDDGEVDVEPPTLPSTPSTSTPEAVVIRLPEETPFNRRLRRAAKKPAKTSFDITKDVQVELFENDFGFWDKDDRKGNTTLDSNGHFKLEGKENESGQAEFYIKVTHYCSQDFKKRCVKYKIPKEFVYGKDAKDAKPWTVDADLSNLNDGC